MILMIEPKVPGMSPAAGGLDAVQLIAALITAGSVPLTSS